jgi:PAS domain S-box-containing protein
MRSLVAGEELNVRLDPLQSAVESHGDAEIAGLVEQLAVGIQELQAAEEELRARNLDLLKARDDLERERERYDDLFERAPDAYILTDLYGIIRRANRAAARLLNINADFLAGKPIFVLILPEDRRMMRQLLLRSRRNGPIQEVRLRMTPSRSPIPRDVAVSLDADPPRTGRGREVRWLVRDVSERRRAEDAERANVELAQSNRDKDDLLGMVSHELRTPLTLVFGNAELLHLRGDRLTYQERRDVVAEIYENARRLGGLIENMLMLARLDRAGSEPEPVLLQRLLPGLVDEARRRAAGHELELRVDRDLPPVMGEPASIQQVLENLIGNAAKYSPPGAAIEVRAWPSEDHVAVAVLDDGPGIPAEELQRVVEPFMRSRGTAVTVPGLGLGLTVCKRLVDSMNGRLWLRLREHGGLEAGFSLPVVTHPGD